ncbi:alpha/beta fold hydrolase BchO [Oceanibium sediminis]|uniref:alpha/beta fold hydrolase BchO n=1 Tax=Oceanibium sediminis TaxID=2026339 RepID=UPI000DD3DFA8|nr:alpha/beta fold hydrolase BchO [Oceanibium sediminis]
MAWPPDWPNAEMSRMVETRSYRWHVQQAGQGPDVLLLHGAGAATHSWRGMLPRLAGRARVCAMDLPGHGFTQTRVRGRVGLRPMAEDVTQLLSTLGMTPALVIGHSAGCALALEMARAQGLQSRLLGLNPALAPFEGIAGWLFPSLARVLALNPLTAPFVARTTSAAAVARLIDSTGSRIDAEGMRCYLTLMRRASHIEGTLRMMSAWNLGPLLEALPDIAMPCRMMTGARDSTVPPATTRRAIESLPAATLESVAGLGHLMHEEDPARFSEIALTMLGGAGD